MAFLFANYRELLENEFFWFTVPSLPVLYFNTNVIWICKGTTILTSIRSFIQRLSYNCDPSWIVKLMSICFMPCGLRLTVHLFNIEKCSSMAYQLPIWHSFDFCGNFLPFSMLHGMTCLEIHYWRTRKIGKCPMSSVHELQLNFTWSILSCFKSSYFVGFVNVFYYRCNNYVDSKV